MTPVHVTEFALAELQAEFPNCNVREVARSVAKWASSRVVHDEEKLLRNAIAKAESRGTYRLSSGAETGTPEAPAGMFRADGSWANNGHGDAEFHRFVDMLVTARRRGYEPWKIAERIMRESDWATQFPNALTWAGQSDWHLCPCATSAEQCVKDHGLGPGGARADEVRSESSYAAFRFALLQRVTDGLTPPQVADILAEHQAKFADLPADTPGFDTLGQMLDGEIASLRAMGPIWQPSRRGQGGPPE